MSKLHKDIPPNIERIKADESTGKIILTVIILIVAFCVVPAIVIAEVYNVSEILAQIF